MFLNFTHQQIQAALAGQGVALARLALVGESLAQGDLVEPFGPTGRITSPFAYWLVRWPARRDRPEVHAFENWLLAQAATNAPAHRQPHRDLTHGPAASAKIPRVQTAKR